MKVRELIEMLKNAPLESEVFVESGSHQYQWIVKRFHLDEDGDGGMVILDDD
jgi:hypothetical protein